MLGGLSVSPKGGRRLGTTKHVLIGYLDCQELRPAPGELHKARARDLEANFRRPEGCKRAI